MSTTNDPRPPSPPTDARAGAPHRGKPGIQTPRSFELVLVVASADGLVAIGQLLAELPADFHPAVAVVLHRLPSSARVAAILAKRCRLPVKDVSEGDVLQPGTVYLAPADHHLTVSADRALHLTDGRRIKHLRSSANPLFESAADAFGSGVIAVVLTGSGSDGTDGVQRVKQMGGVVIAQDPVSSAFAFMPEAAISSGAVDLVLPLSEIGRAIVELTSSTGRA